MFETWSFQSAVGPRAAPNAKVGVKRRDRAASTPPTTEGRLVYAVGDIHGRLDLLRLLIRDIADDYARSGGGRAPMVIFLGDYIDRGADPRGVVDLIIALWRRTRIEVRCLKGNHEQALLRFLDDPAEGPLWARHGGAATLQSYGVSPPSGPTPAAWASVRDAFAAALPDDHLAFYRSLPLSCAVGDYMFVHAGVRHGVELSAQSEQDMLSIRDDFLNEKRPFGKVIVHGHSASERPFVGANRIGVDTGAYATGVLTAARLEGTDRGFITAGHFGSGTLASSLARSAH